MLIDIYLSIYKQFKFSSNEMESDGAFALPYDNVLLHLRFISSNANLNSLFLIKKISINIFIYQFLLFVPLNMFFTNKLIYSTNTRYIMHNIYKNIQ